jgi:hypothetical protein
MGEAWWGWSRPVSLLAAGVGGGVGDGFAIEAGEGVGSGGWAWRVGRSCWRKRWVGRDFLHKGRRRLWAAGWDRRWVEELWVEVEWEVGDGRPDLKETC